MRIRQIACFLSLIFLLTACGKQKIKVGLIVSDNTEQKTDVEGLKKVFEKYNHEFEYELLSLDKIKTLPLKHDILWYHRSDSSEIKNNEKEIGNTIVKFVSEGGKLILSMEAVRLLNTWGIESTNIKSKNFKAKDEGFGRKIGFHGFREHPIFDKMFGGAYTWHGKEDNDCRILGFFDGTLPGAANTNVIGTLWEYIFYHPKDKVLWETPLGKGNILAIGGCLYYSKENFHTQILEQFTNNCLHYMHGDKWDSKSKYWNYNVAEIVLSIDTFKTIPLSKSVKWELADESIKLGRKASPHYYTLPSQRSIIIGQENGGIEEIWTHPFMSLRDYRVFLDVKGIDTLVALKSDNADFEIHSNAVVRTYQCANTIIKEIITSRITEPVTVVHYEWEGNNIQGIVTDFKSNLRFMWPYDETSLGSLHYKWSEELNAFVVMDANKEFCSLVGANTKGKNLSSGRYDGFTYDKNKQATGIISDKLQIASSVYYDLKDQNTLDILMVAGNNSANKVIEEYTSGMANTQEIFKQSSTYYRNYLADHFSITTPDSVFNEGFKWATLSSAQFIVETPGIGTSLMAGYSSSRRGWGGAQKVSGRPGYAWYFGRDAIWAGFAFDGIGDFKTVKNILETLIRFQQVDGKIYHELTSSGSVHFDASDATPLFVNMMAHYLRNSGDIEFVKQNMSSIHKAMDYCYSTDTDGDRLIEISNVGHGWLEGGKLYGSHTEFYLIGIWNAALNDAAYLSSVVKDSEKEKKYLADAQTINKIINNDFWNNKGYFNYGKRKDGSYTDEAIILTTVPVYFGVTDTEKSLEMMRLFGTNSFSTDWGVRMISESHELFNPSAYHFGSVWPLFTGWTSLAEYGVGYYNQGFSRIMSNLYNYKNFSLGRVPEVLNGSVYKSSGVTLHQCWSETMVLQPVIEGMLGFKPDAINNTMTLAPRIPFDWQNLQVKNLYVGKNAISFDMIRKKDKVRYGFISKDLVSTKFRPTFALGTQIKKVTANGKEIPFKKTSENECLSIEASFDIQTQTIIEIEYSEGMAALASIVLPKTDSSSSGFRVLDQALKDKALVVNIEGRTGSTYQLELYLPNGYKQFEGGTNIRQLKDYLYIADITLEKGASRYTTKQIKVIPK